MLKSRKTGNHPIMLGPVMIHHRKTYETYYTLASRVAAANPKLKDVKGIVTDGKEPLQNSFSHIFSNAQPLRDFRHFRQNMDNALKDLGISAKKDRTPFLNDVFGYAENNVYIKGLCDSDNVDEFRVMLDSFRPLWKDREALLIGGTSEKVYNWISTRGEVICKTMIREPREKAGLGNPPRKAYSNMSEAINHILSVRCPGPQPVITFVEAVHEEVRSQQDEVIRALYGRGEYELCSEYKHLEVSEEDWFQARPEQRQKYVQQINKLTMEELMVSLLYHSCILYR